MSDFEEKIFDKLLAIQEERPDLIAAEIDVLDAYGLARSFVAERRRRRKIKELRPLTLIT
jgi:hypothetical protein